MHIEHNGDKKPLRVVKQDAEKDLILYTTPVLGVPLALSKDKPDFGESMYVYSRLLRKDGSHLVVFHVTVANPLTKFGAPIPRASILIRGSFESGQSGSPLLNLNGELVSVANRRMFGIAYRDVKEFLD